MMLTFICYQSELLTVMHGFAMGVFIEGGARWGFDPIWTEKKSDPENMEIVIDDFKITKPKQVFKHTSSERRRWVDIKYH